MPRPAPSPNQPTPILLLTIFANILLVFSWCFLLQTICHVQTIKQKITFFWGCVIGLIGFPLFVKCFVKAYRSEEAMYRICWAFLRGVSLNVSSNYFSQKGHKAPLAFQTRVSNSSVTPKLLDRTRWIADLQKTNTYFLEVLSLSRSYEGLLYPYLGMMTCVQPEDQGSCKRWPLVFGKSASTPGFFQGYEGNSAIRGTF